MQRRSHFTALSTVLIFVILAAGLQIAAIYAQSGPTATPGASDSFPVTAILIGKVWIVAQDGYTYEDGTSVRLDPAAQRNAGVLAPGALVLVRVRFEGDMLIADYLTSQTNTFNRPELQGALFVALLQYRPEVSAPIATEEPTRSAPEVTAPLPVECSGAGHNPIAALLAIGFEVSYVDVLGWRCQGFDFSEVARAYTLARAITGGARNSTYLFDIFAARSAGQSWVQIARAKGIDLANLASAPLATEPATLRAPAATEDADDRGRGGDDDEDKDNDDDKGRGKDKEDDKDRDKSRDDDD